MRKFKIAIWMIVVYIIQTVFCGVIDFNGTAPDLLLAFTVIFAFYELELKATTVIILLSGVLSGSEAGRIFPAVMIVTGIAGLLSRGLFKMFKFVPQCIKIISVIIVASFLLCSFEYFAMYKSIPAAALMESILPYVAYTGVAGCIMYPIVKRTLFSNRNQKQLIV